MFVVQNEGVIQHEISELPMSSGISPQVECRSLPSPGPIAEVNVVNASDILVGNKIINISGDSAQIVKDSVELMSKANSNSNKRTIRCSCAVYACLAIFVLIGILAFVFITIYSAKAELIELGIIEPWFLRKQQWQPINPSKIVFLNTPISNLILLHTGTSYCSQFNACIRLVRRIQNEHMTLGMYPDIGFNYLIGGGGLIFEGCGGNVIGNFLTGWNDRALSVAFIGNYTFGNDETDNAQFENLELVLTRLVEKQVLVSNYKLLAVCQITGKINPGGNIIRNMSKFANWDRENVTNCPEF